MLLLGDSANKGNPLLERPLGRLLMDLLQFVVPQHLRFPILESNLKRCATGKRVALCYRAGSPLQVRVSATLYYPHLGTDHNFLRVLRLHIRG